MRYLIICLLLLPTFAYSKLVDVVVKEKQTFSFEERQYEAVKGQFLYEFDPLLAQNQRIVDLNKAPLNTRGRVEASADFFVIQPQNPTHRRGMLFEISNRGSKAALRYFNKAPRESNPMNAYAIGDGFIQRQGLSLMWVGWQPDVKAQNHAMTVALPRAMNTQGVVRSDWTLNETQTRLSLAHREQIAVLYTIDRNQENNAFLTKREGRHGVKTIVPKTKWNFNEQGDAIEGEFTAGIYELVYPSSDSVVGGLGLALIRDTAEFIKTKDAPFFVPKTLAFGVSQTGRWLRHFLYQGFNQTESNTRAFDGMLIHTAGAGRGSFNHRFAQPSRDAHRMSAFFYPTDLFPFASRALDHPLTGKPDGLLNAVAPRHTPKIFYTNTGYEYWGRAAALIHTYNEKDLEPLNNERIFHLASGQHFVESQANVKPIDSERRVYQGNPLNFLLSLRALLSNLSDWVIDDKTPLKSQYPRFENRTLVAHQQYNLPEKLSFLRLPTSPHTAFLADYGGEWEQGIVTQTPPRLLATFVPPVPVTDGFGNELGGLRHPLLEVPLASFLPWVLRNGLFAEHEIMDFRGSMVLMSAQLATQTYTNQNEYLRQLNLAINRSIKANELLEEDLQDVLAQGRWLWQKVMANQ